MWRAVIFSSEGFDGKNYDGKNGMKIDLAGMAWVYLSKR